MPTAKSAGRRLRGLRASDCGAVVGGIGAVDHALVVVFWVARYIDHARRCLTLTNLCALNSQFRHSATDARRWSPGS